MIPRHLLIAMVVLVAAALGLSIYAWHVRKSVVHLRPLQWTRGLWGPL